MNKAESRVNEELREGLYRSGYITQVIGFIFYVISLFATTEFQTRLFTLSAYIVISMGVILTASFLRVSKKRVKHAAVGLSVAGFLLFLIFYTLNFALLAELSFGLVLVAAAILFGKEAHCYSYIEGRVLNFVFPLMVASSVAVLFVDGAAPARHVMWLIGGTVVASFVARKSLTPLNKQPHSDSDTSSES